MKRVFALGYGAVGYVTFLFVFAGLVDFLGGSWFVRGIDSGAEEPALVASSIDVALIALFGVSHSVMARPWFKSRWTRLVPEVVERSTYVLVASIILALIIWLWRPLPTRVWNVEAPTLRVAIWFTFGAGVVLIVASTFLTDHFDLFGLRRVWLLARARSYTPPPFQERGVYRFVRHPMMVGVLVWLWAAPSMSVGHLILAAGMSAYVGIGIRLEDRDLARTLGEPYRDYRRRVRAVLPVRR